MLQPETRFVSVGRDRVAYQVFGDGSTDVLHLTPFGVSVDAAWEHPGHLRTWRLASAHARVIMLDHRGVGMSDPLPESRLGNLDDRMDDVLAVLDEVGADQVCVNGESDAGLTAIKLAVEHHARVDKLVLVNGYAKGSAGDGYEYGASADRVERLAEMVLMAWGTGAVVAAVCPHLAGDPAFLARFERMAARPSVAAALVRNLATADVRPLLGRIATPTLVVYSGDLTTVTVEQSRHLAQQIPNARLFERSSSTFYWGGGVLEEIVAFMSGVPSTGDRELLTLLFTDVVDSTGEVVAAGDGDWRQTLDFLDDLVTNRASRAGGRVVKQTGDGHLVEFGRPGDAVSAAIALCRDAPTLGVALRAGVHTGEVERRENGDLGGLTVHIAARIAASAQANEVVVSRTVADLLGSSYVLHDRGECELKGVPGRWTLLTVGS